MKRSTARLGALIAAVAFSMSALAQSQQQTRVVVVNGHSGQATVFQIDGHSYIDLETLARIANGSVSFQGNQIVLAFPSDGVASSPTKTAVADSSVLSDDFSRAAVQELGILKDWESTIGYALQKAVPGDGSRMVVFRNRATEGLRLATVAANTDSDRSALELLTNHYHQVDGWYEKLVEARKSMSTADYSLSAEGLSNDPAYQKISACSKFLGAMLASGKYSDDGSCH